MVPNLLSISNFRFLVQEFCLIFDFFLSSSAPPQNFPLGMHRNSASFGLCSGTSALRRLFNCCCLYCITCHALWALFVFPPSSNPLFDSKLKNHYLRAFFTVVSSYTWRWWFAQKYNHYCVRYRAQALVHFIQTGPLQVINLYQLQARQIAVRNKTT